MAEKADKAETEQRLLAILKGAFQGPPTPLKDIPTRKGKRRADPANQPRRRRQRKKRTA